MGLGIPTGITLWVLVSPAVLFSVGLFAARSRYKIAILSEIMSTTSWGTSLELRIFPGFVLVEHGTLGIFNLVLVAVQ